MVAVPTPLLVRLTVASTSVSEVCYYRMKAFRTSMLRWMNWITPAMILLTIIGFHRLPVLWIPLVLIFVAAWIMGIRTDRKAGLSRKR
jgi:hypothetical protein